MEPATDQIKYSVQVLSAIFHIFHYLWMQLGLLLYTHGDLSTSRIFHLYNYGEICSNIQFSHRFDGYFPVTYMGMG